MASRVTMEIFGNPKLAAIKANKKSLEGLVMATVALAKTLVQVDTGELQNTVMGLTADSEFGFNESPGNQAPGDHKLDLSVPENTGIVGTASDHWYSEFGTRYQQAQPFLRPAITYMLGGRALSIVKKWNQEEMVRQFKEGVRQFTEYKSGEIVPPSKRA